RFHLIDPYGVRPTRTVSELELAILRALGAGATWTAIRELARRRDVELERAEVEEFTAELDRAGMFDGPEGEAARREAAARGIVGGTLVVPAPPDAGTRCSALLDDARVANARELGPGACEAWLEGFLSPHGDLETTGEVAARAYAMLAADRWP